MSDTSFFDSRIYQEQMQTESLRQDAARLEIEYWMLKLEQVKNPSLPAALPKKRTDESM